MLSNAVASAIAMSVRSGRAPLGSGGRRASPSPAGERDPVSIIFFDEGDSLDRRR